MAEVILGLIFLLIVPVVQSSGPCTHTPGNDSQISETPVEISARELSWNGSVDTLYEQNTTTNDPGSVTEDETKQAFLRFQNTMKKYFSVIVVVLGTLGSTLTVIILHRGALQSSSAVYIMGMGYANIIFSFVNIITKMSHYENFINTAVGKSLFSFHSSYIFPFNFIAISISAWVILAFAIERCLAIYYPMKHYLFSSESRAKKIVMAIFVVAFLTNITRFFRITVKLGTDPVTNESLYVYYYTEFGRNAVHNAVLYWYYATTVTLVPIPLLIVLTILIIAKLRSVRKKRQNLKEGDQGLSESESKRVQIERVLVGSMLTFLLCNIPVACTVITVAIRGNNRVFFGPFILGFRVLFFIATTCSEFRALVDFIMYVCCSTEIRNSVKALFGMANKKKDKCLS